jgi:hypothetical protein
MRPVVLALLFVVCFLATGAASAQISLPDQISDQEFWRLVSEFSEPSGPYTGDNWISNEASIQNVIPALRQITKPGGVYLGVGPEQNFTYMWAMQSRLGFVVDIRRQNMLTIMLFKALFELAPDRADFVSRLFSRQRPAGLDANTNIKALMSAFGSAPKEGLAANTEAVHSVFAKHGFALSADDLSTIDFVYGIFNRGGPAITAEFASPGSPAGVPVTYTDLMTATDRNGQAWSYLSSDAAYQYVRELHRKNLIIPLVGDFAGRSTLRKISEYLKQRNAKVTVFYVSNVENYLKAPGVLQSFHANVAALPIDASSMFVRWAPIPSVGNVPWFTPEIGGVWGVVTTLQPMAELVELINAGRAPASYADTLKLSKDPMLLAAQIQDPSLRRVTGRVNGMSGLKPNEIVRVELVESLRAGGTIISADVAADGSFALGNVPPRTYQAIILRACKGCSAARVGGSPVNVVVAEKDVSGLQLALDPQ